MKIKNLKNKLNKEGYFKIYSNILKDEIYIIKDEAVLPPDNIPTYTLKEINLLVNADKDTLRKLHLIKKELKAKVISYGKKGN